MQRHAGWLGDRRCLCISSWHSVPAAACYPAGACAHTEQPSLLPPALPLPRLQPPASGAPASASWLRIVPSRARCRKAAATAARSSGCRLVCSTLSSAGTTPSLQEAEVCISRRGWQVRQARHPRCAAQAAAAAPALAPPNRYFCEPAGQNSCSRTHSTSCARCPSLPASTCRITSTAATNCCSSEGACRPPTCKGGGSITRRSTAAPPQTAAARTLPETLPTWLWNTRLGNYLTSGI